MVTTIPRQLKLAPDAAQPAAYRMPSLLTMFHSDPFATLMHFLCCLDREESAPAAAPAVVATSNAEQQA